jgi:hypothetical protein
MIEKLLATRRLVIVTHVVLVVAVMGLFAYALSAPDIGDADFERIQPGMTEAEVIRIFGLPPGNYRTYNVSYAPLVSVGRWPQGTTKEWQVDSRYIIIWFQDGRVESKAECLRFSDPVWICKIKDAVGWESLKVGVSSFFGQ